MRHENQVARDMVASLYWHWRAMNKHYLQSLQTDNKDHQLICIAHEAEAQSIFLSSYRYLKAVSK